MATNHPKQGSYEESGTPGYHAKEVPEIQGIGAGEVGVFKGVAAIISIAIITLNIIIVTTVVIIITTTIIIIIIIIIRSAGRTGDS
eukprot:4848481-Karenia_brevis.AAC.1